MATMQLLVETPGPEWRESDQVAGAGDLLRDHNTLLWLDVADPGPAEIEVLRREFGFHELALEDVARAHQRPKCDTYEDYYFIVVYAGTHAPDRFQPTELQIFWGRNYVVTIHRGALDVLTEARQRWQSHNDRPDDGVAYLVYTLLDSLVDGYFPLIDWVAEQVDGIEEQIFARADSAVLAQLFRLRKELLSMRRLLAPTRDVVNELIRRDLPLVPLAMQPYFADVYDHALRVLDGLDVYRDLLASALDLHLSAVSNRLNQTMKRMTALTLIVMVPTLIAGIYGMNFERSVPRFDWDGGFAYAVGLMAFLVLGGLALGRRLEWL